MDAPSHVMYSCPPTRKGIPRHREVIFKKVSKITPTFPSIERNALSLCFAGAILYLIFEKKKFIFCDLARKTSVCYGEHLLVWGST